MDEAKLVRDCVQGKLLAQKQLYDIYAPQMLGICYRYTRSMSDAEDILQEGFLKVFHNIKQFKGEGELGAWIRRIIVTTALNYLKRNKRYREEMFFTEEFLHPVTTDNPDVVLNAKEIADLVRQLPQGYQVIFNLHALEGYSHIEIGQMLGISDSTSRSQYFRARNLLITWIEKFSIESKIDGYGSK